MSVPEPGWYPDPEGGGGSRYWDGRTWAPATDQGASRNRGTVWAGLGLVAVVVVVMAVIFQPWRNTPWAGTPEDHNSSRPTGSQWDEGLPPSTPPPEAEDDNGGKIVECSQTSDEQRSEIRDGRIAGGGLSFEARPDWHQEHVWLPWVYDHNSQIRTISPGWMSNLSVGYVKAEEGFTNPRQAAHGMMSCLATSDLYPDMIETMDIRDEAFSLDGRDGWRMTAEVRVGGRDVAGDVVDVVVLDLGKEGQLSVYVSCATIDDGYNLDEVEDAFHSLRVDG